MSHFGTDPGDLTQDEMYGREPVESVEPMDRADCGVCKGSGKDTEIVTSDEGSYSKTTRCWACNGRGVEQTRDDLSAFTDDDDLRLVPEVE